MGKLTDKTIKALQEKLNAESEFIRIAGDLLGKASSRSYISGFENTDREIITVNEAKKLEKTILTVLKREKRPRVITGLVWALSKANNKSLAPIIRECLIRNLNVFLDYNAIVSQCVMALNNLGEIKLPTDGSVKSMGLDQIDQNVSLAREYLKKIGVVLP